MRYIRYVCAVLVILGVLLLATAVASASRMHWHYRHDHFFVVGTWWFVVWQNVPRETHHGGLITIVEFEGPTFSWQSYAEAATPDYRQIPVMRRVQNGGAVAWWVLFAAWEFPLALLYLAAWKFDRRRIAQRDARRKGFPVEPIHHV